MEVTVNLDELTQYDVDIELLECIDKEIIRLVKSKIKQAVQQSFTEEIKKEIDHLVYKDIFTQMRSALSDDEFQTFIKQASVNMLASNYVKTFSKDIEDSLNVVKTSLVKTAGKS